MTEDDRLAATSGVPVPSRAPGVSANPSRTAACSGKRNIIEPSRQCWLLRYPCIRTMSKTTRLASVSIPASGSRIGITIVSGRSADSRKGSLS